MALAYAIVLVASDLWDHSRSQCIELGQLEADGKFQKLAEEARKTLVTRQGSEPYTMTRDEIRHHYPTLDGDFLDHVVGLLYQADIT